MGSVGRSSHLAAAGNTTNSHRLRLLSPSITHPTPQPFLHHNIYSYYKKRLNETIIVTMAVVVVQVRSSRCCSSCLGKNDDNNDDDDDGNNNKREFKQRS